MLKSKFSASSNRSVELLLLTPAPPRVNVSWTQLVGIAQPRGCPLRKIEATDTLIQPLVLAALEIEDHSLVRVQGMLDADRESGLIVGRARRIVDAVAELVDRDDRVGVVSCVAV